jgi:hypothetical protein
MMTLLARELQCDDKNWRRRTRRQRNRTGTTTECAHHQRLEYCGSLLLGPLMLPVQSLSAANQGLTMTPLPMMRRVSYPDCKDEKGGANVEFMLMSANIRDCIAVVGVGRVMAKLCSWA